MLLKDRNTITYGAAGSIGSAVARTFAREGATVHLAGRTREPLQALADMTAEDFLRPVTAGLTATFHSARAAARVMAEQGSGVILSLTSGSARDSAPMMGGTGPADAATETFRRYLAAEMGPRGVRVAGIYAAGVAGTLTVEKVADVDANAPDLEQIDRMLKSFTMVGRRTELDDVAETAAFLASDRAAGITATTVNVTNGMVPGP